jgi:GT2 family glycosyltransferase
MSLDRRDADGFGALLRWAAEQAVEGADRPSHDRVPRWGQNATEDGSAYDEWWARHRRERDGDSAPPIVGARFSVVVWLADTSVDELRSCVESIRRQTASDWEAVLVGPVRGNDQTTRDELAAVVRSDPRFRVVGVEPDEVPGAGPRGGMAFSGDYVAFVDASDLLEPDALARVGAVLAPGVDVVYSDEDELEPDGSHSRPVFKPDWSPDLLLSEPYLGSLLVVSRSVLETIERSDADPDADIDYDLMLRASEAADTIVHVPEVLYHRRVGHPATRPGADDDRVRRALEVAVTRRGVDGAVERAETTDRLHVRRSIRGAPSVSIVIPFRDQASLLARCMESLPIRPGYDNYDIVLVDNGSVEPETRALRTQLEERYGATVIEYPGAFNWSAINNVGAAAAKSDFLLFLNNDIEATGEGWLRALVEQGQRPEVGVVGARLFYPDGTLQHAGIVVGTGVIGWHIFMGLPPSGSAYLGWDRAVRPYSAVTGACFLTRRDVFDALGGFDETLEVAFNDVDYCLRARDLGYEVLYTPHAVLIHNEAMSRGLAGYRADGRRFLAKWDRSRLREDPFFNRNLSRFAAWCPLRQPGEDQLWEAYVDDLAGSVT